MPEMSDEELRALPTTVNLSTAARALGIGTTKAYKLARAGEFPCPVLPVGARFRVTKHHLFEALGMSMTQGGPVPGKVSGKDEVKPAKPVAVPPPPTATVVPEGGIPVVLVLQAVLLPGNWEQFMGTHQ